MIFTLSQCQLRKLATKVITVTKVSFKKRKYIICILPKYYSEVWVYTEGLYIINSNRPRSEFEFDKTSLFGYQDNHFTTLLVYKTQP